MKLTVRRAEIEDVSSILNLLIQVDMVHHLGRPDLFKGPATKYSREELINVWECNPCARKFYESLGMQPQKITMEKILGE